MSYLLNSYQDLVKFVNSLPGSAPTGGIIIDKGPDIDPRVIQSSQAQEVIYLFNKYRMTQVDRERLVTYILNVRILDKKKKVKHDKV